MSKTSLAMRWRDAFHRVPLLRNFRDAVERVPTGHYAPNLSNILAFACIRRMRYFASKTPSEPSWRPFR